MISTVETTLRRSREFRPIKISQQIADDLRDKIASGEFIPGSSMPSRRALAREFGVSLGTMQEAVNALIDEGVLTVRSTARTEVANVPAASENRLAPATQPAIAAKDARDIGIVCDLKPRNNPETNIWNHVIVSAIERELMACGCTTHFFNQYKYPPVWPNSADALSILLDQNIKTVILVFPDSEYSMPALTRWSRTATAADARVIVVCDRPLPQPFISVYWLNDAVGHEAAAHLIAQGCQRIVFFSHYGARWMTRRVETARDAVEALGGGTCSFEEIIGDNPWEPRPAERSEAAYRFARGLVHKECDGLGVIAANDFAALGWMKAAAEIGQEAGRDYAIIGADDMVEAREADLSTFVIPLEALAVETVRQALSPPAQNGPTNFGIQAHILARKSTRLLRPR
ncbi:MAG: GntR family transcriptional regulator [Capsulimonadaceae bacterium]|nr:GntR family transcriptional regulator [Capsulimonadaceae bacterium]